MSGLAQRDLIYYNGEYTNPRNRKTLLVPVAVFAILYIYSQREDDVLIPQIVIQVFLLLTSGWFFYLVYMYLFAKRYSNPVQSQQIEEVYQKDSQRFALQNFDNYDGARNRGREEFTPAYSNYPRTEALGSQSYEYAEKIVGNLDDFYGRNNKPVHKSQLVEPRDDFRFDSFDDRDLPERETNQRDLLTRSSRDYLRTDQRSFLEFDDLSKGMSGNSQRGGLDRNSGSQQDNRFGYKQAMMQIHNRMPQGQTRQPHMDNQNGLMSNLRENKKLSDGWRTVGKTDANSNSGYFSTHKSMSKATPHGNFQHFLNQKQSTIKGTHSKRSIASAYSHPLMTIEDQGKCRSQSQLIMQMTSRLTTTT